MPANAKSIWEKGIFPIPSAQFSTLRAGRGRLGRVCRLHGQGKTLLGWGTAAPCTSRAEGKAPFMFEVGGDSSVEPACQGRNSSDLFRTVQKVPLPLPETLNL